MNYINRLRNNLTEMEVQKYFYSQGYSSLSRGWPDFVFFKNGDYIFVEVKRADQNKIKPHQEEMRRIFKRLGIKYEVCFGIKDEKPDFRDKGPP